MPAAAVRKQSLKLWRSYRGMVFFLLLMLGFRSAWADWVTVPTGSMNPTILEGDRVLVNKHVFGLRVPFTLIHLTEGERPMRGDIVVFDSPVNGISLVKRVVGVPGDVLSLDERGLIINGEPAQYAIGDAALVDTLLTSTIAQSPVMLREAVEGKEHEIMRLPFRNGGGFGTVEVPEGMYFMLGDNRDNSADSRVFGFVPRRNIVGRATRVVASLNPEAHYLPRWNRFLTPLD
jgi:signal peptidase I